MPQRPLRVVHTVTSLLQGGMEHFVLRLARAQREMGHDASILAIRSGPLLEQAQALGVPVYVLDQGGKLDRITRTVTRVAALRPDVLHAHNTTSLHFAVLGRCVSGARIVLTDHAQLFRTPAAVEWCLTDAAVAVSKATAEKCTANRAFSDILVVHNGIDICPAKRERATVRAELGLGQQIVGIQVARFVDLKAQDVVVRALARLKARGMALTMLFLGDGPRLSSIKELSNNLGLGEDEVRFLGFRTDVADLLAASDVFVSPSRSEGLPLSILEAMSHSLPVLVTPVGGVPELCSHGEHALFVPVDDDDALAQGLERLAKDPDLRRRLGENGLNRVLTQFSFKVKTQRYEELYRELLAETAWQRGTHLFNRIRRVVATRTPAAPHLG